MALTIKPIRAGNPAFAGEVSGIDLTQPLSRADADAIDASMDRYGVLVFHDQDITDAQQIAFSTALGPLEVKKRPGNIRKASESRLGAGSAFTFTLPWQPATRGVQWQASSSSSSRTTTGT